MTETDLQQYKATIRSFEQRVINRSVSQLFILDKVADILLDCFTKIKPATFSFLSFFPLAILAGFIQGGSSLWFGLSALVLFIHQIMDVSNKKQAYREYQFSLGTFYIDHMYDSLSVGLIVYIIATLMDFTIQNVWLCIFCFGMLPFYISHLRMYYTGYMQFQAMSPSAQGLILLEIAFIVAIFIPNLFQLPLFSNIMVYHLILAISTAWVLYYIGKEFWEIRLGSKSSGEIAIKNLFIILALGYIYFQNTIISPHLLNEHLFFTFLFLVNALHFSVLIGNMIMSYGTGCRFNQISLNTLLVNSGVIALYSALFFIQLEDIQILLAKIFMGVMVGLEALYFVYNHRKTINQINQAIHE